VATRTSRPGRALLVFLIAVIGLYTAVAAKGNWEPKLGLDLQGGTRITLKASASGGEGGLTEEKLDEAVGIISSRVNGAGVAESEVTTQGSDIIIIEIPGAANDNLAETIGSTAQLRFRLVSLMIPAAGEPTEPEQTPTPSTPSATGETPTSPSATGETLTSPSNGTPTPRPSDETETGPKPSPGTSTTPKSRVAPSYEEPGSLPAPAAPATQTPSEQTSDPDPTPSDSTSEPTETTQTEPTTPTESAPMTPAPSGPPTGLVPPDLEQIDDPYAWIASPPQDWQAKTAQYTCTPEGAVAQPQLDIPSQPLVACDEDGNRYLLGPSMVEGTDVSNASSGIPQAGLNYAVQVEFTGEGSDKFGDVTSRIASQQNTLTGGEQQLAIVLDGEVLSAPSNDSPITGGNAEITGGQGNEFTKDEADSLANSLKYGALPLTFETQQISDEGPELASNQLSAGILAAIIGLLLVIVYCMFYYRGLGLVVVASLLAAGGLAYASVLLLGAEYGFTLTLPGIAGLIVAVGITADSFIVYFERLRDEVRDGRTLRTSVETGWARARSTILAADAVSMLAAVVLFIFAIGVVKGFAFALGLTTVIDVFVVFFFTKPMVTMLAKTKFFGQGHKLSGLDREHLGMPALPARTRPAEGNA